MAIGWSVTTASRKMMVSPASKILSAISLGVFWRSAPSTSLIMRSRKVSPGLDVISTMISSESTRVPPVTAERSPPHSRITGADSPVIADSSTEATPCTTSPSPGMNSPAITLTLSPTRSFDPAISSMEPSCRMRRATVSARALRRVSACALPRPSAMASAKFAKSTVNHSQSVICSSKPNPLRCCKLSRTRSQVVIAAPTSTTNITGFFMSVRGLSLRIESRSAPPTMPPVHIDFFLCSLEMALPGSGMFAGDVEPSSSMDCMVMAASENPSGVHQQVFENRAEAESREKSKCADNQNHGDQQECKKRRGYRERTSRFGHDLLARKVASHGQNRDNHEEAPEQHVESSADVVPRCVSIQTGESRAVIAGLGRIGVENLREAVRAGIADGRGAERGHNRNASKAENQKAEDEHRYHGHLHIKGFYLFAEIFRRSSHHQAGDKNRKNNENDDSVHSRAHSAENNLADHDVYQWHHAAERSK